jgi:hypothetical protein
LLTSTSKEYRIWFPYPSAAIPLEIGASIRNIKTPEIIVALACSKSTRPDFVALLQSIKWESFRIISD